ncbi:MAG: HAD family hydrolase [bacterium]|nr:HAD family hydrolase [bacterium]
MQTTEARRPAVFLDRDGTIIDETGYLGDPGGVHFYPGAVEAMKRLQEAGYLLVVLTNQSGIARGYFDEGTAVAVNLAMMKMLSEHSLRIDAVYYCPHHPDDGCQCRKPQNLMARRAAGDLGVDTGRSWMIGDTARDVFMGDQSGLHTVLVETGKDVEGNLPVGTVRVRDLAAAVTHILKEEGK